MSTQHTIIEARLKDEIVRIGTCTDPLFVDGRILIPRALIEAHMGFRLKEVDVAEWLKKQLIILTRVTVSDGCHGTTSWVCRYISSNQISRFEGMYILTDLVLEHGRTYEQ